MIEVAKTRVWSYWITLSIPYLRRVGGIGFLAIPTLAGSTAYAFAETLGWRQAVVAITAVAMFAAGVAMFVV